MATTLQELLVRIGADVSGLTDGLSGAMAALDKAGESAKRTGNVISKAFESLGVGDSFAKVASQMKNLQSSFALIDKAYQEGKVSAADYAKAQEGLRTQMERLSGIAKPLAMEFDKLGEAFKAIGASKTQFQIGSQITELKKNLDYLDAAYKAGKISAADFAKAQESVRVEIDKLTKVPVQTFADQLANLGKAGDSLRSLGTTLTAAVTVPIVGIAAASVKMAGDFEASMNKVQAFGEITGDSLKKLENLALDLGAKTKFSAKEAADGMAELAAAGLNASQIAAAMPAILNLAAAGELAVGEAARVSADLMGQFGIKAEDLGHAIDVIAKAAAASSATVAQMTESFRVVGAVATSAGLSLEDTSAALAVLAQGGRKAEQAGTDLRSVLASLLDPSDEAATAMEALGINAKDSEGKLKPFSAVMGELGKAAGHTTEIFKIFGREGATGATLFAKAGEEAFSKIRKNLNDTNDDAKRMAETLNSGIKGAFEKAAGSIETAGIAIGKALGALAEKGAGIVESLANAVAGMVVEFGKLPIPVQGVAISMAALAAATGPVLYAFGGIATGAAATIDAVRGISKALGLASEALGGIQGYGGPAVEAMARLDGKFVSMSASALALGAAIGAVGVAITAIEAYKLGQELGALGDAIANVNEAFGNGHNAIESYRAAQKGLVTAETIQEMTLLEVAVKAVSEGFDAAAKAFSKMDWADFVDPRRMARKAVKELADGLNLLAEIQRGPQLKDNGLVASVAASMKGVGDAALAEAEKFAKAVTAIKTSASDAARELKAAEHVLAEVRAAFKVGAASQQDVALATERVRIAFQRLHPELGTNSEAARKAAEKAERHAESLVKQKDAAILAGGALKKYSDNLEGLNNIKLIKLTLGGPNFKDYEEGLKQFGAEMEAARARVATFYNEVAGGRNATEAIKQLGAAFANTEKALRDFGIESKISYQSLVKQNSDYLKQILRDTDLTNTQKEQARIVFAQREIDLARKTGQEITDAEIESLEKQKAAYAKSHLDIEQSYKILGINSTKEIERQADLVAAAYAKVANSALSSQADIDKAHLAMMKADAEATIAHGKAITETQKRAMEDAEQIVKEGHRTLEGQWDLFANNVGDAIAGLSVALGEKLFTGKGSFGDISKTAWKAIRASLISDFIAPAEEAIGKFISKSIAALLGSEGVAGITKAWKELGETVKSVLGIASNAGKAVSSAGAGVAGGASVFMGDTSEAAGAVAGAASSAGSAGGSAGGATGGLAGAMPFVQAGISAAAGITQGLQMAHLIATTGKVEVNTREMSTVMWQTGAESIQGILKRLLNESIYIGDRLNEIRDSLFDPVTATLEGIWQTLKSGITVNGEVTSGSGEGSTTTSTTAAFRQPGVGDPNFGGPKYLGFVGPLAGNNTAKESLGELTRQLAEANAQLEKIKADRAVYAKELNSMSTGVDRRKELAGIDAINSDKQQGFEGTIKALQYTLDQLSKAVGRGTAEVTQGITSLDGTIQSTALVQGTAAADTAASIQAMAETLKDTFVEGNTGSGSDYSLDLRATDRWGRIIDSFGNTLSSFTDTTASSLTDLTDAIQGAAGGIDGIVLPMSDFMKKLYGAPDGASTPSTGNSSGVTEFDLPMTDFMKSKYGPSIAPYWEPQAMPSNSWGYDGNPTPPVIDPNMLGGRVGGSRLDNTGSIVHVHVNVDGREIGNALVNGLELQGVGY